MKNKYSINNLKINKMIFNPVKNSDRTFSFIIGIILGIGAGLFLQKYGKVLIEKEKEI